MVSTVKIEVSSRIERELYIIDNCWSRALLTSIFTVLTAAYRCAFLGICGAYRCLPLRFPHFYNAFLESTVNWHALAQSFPLFCADPAFSPCEPRVPLETFDVHVENPPLGIPISYFHVLFNYSLELFKPININYSVTPSRTPSINVGHCYSPASKLRPTRATLIEGDGGDWGGTRNFRPDDNPNLPFCEAKSGIK